jgi:UDP-glucuronate 4-epimerase
MGRPDMAYFSFTKKILAGETIDVFNNGEMQRDFTYIDDIVEGIIRVMERPPENNPPCHPEQSEGSPTSDAVIPNKTKGSPADEQDSGLRADFVASNTLRMTEEKITNAVAPYKIYNIGNNQPVTLRRFITAIETACGKKAKEKLLPMQPGDVPVTFADVDNLIADTGFKPTTTIEDGIAQFVEWYRSYYQK